VARSFCHHQDRPEIRGQVPPGIVSRFGVLSRIITDNGTQFTSALFEAYCEDKGIRICYASSHHPQSNGQAEHTNTEILKGLKTRTFESLKDHGKKWMEHLESVLWVNRTTPSWATGETPLFLVHGAEAVLPPEVMNRSPRVNAFDESL